MTALGSADVRVGWAGGDDGDDLVFVARLILRDDGAPDTWNGFVLPAFARAEVERLMAYNNADVADEVDRLSWDGGDVLLTSATHDIERVEPITGPDGIARWPVGAGAWTWQTVAPIG